MKKLLPLIFLLPVLAACPPLEEWEKLRGNFMWKTRAVRTCTSNMTDG